ncbi:MAG: hypothetical protein AAF757_02850 [Cyanobacteria bacterium P01_D01_bin.116]
MNNQSAKKSNCSFINRTAMNKIFSKISLFLIIVANTSPVLAASKLRQIEYQHNSQEVIVAGLFDKLINTVDKFDQTRDRIERRDIQRRERKQRLRERKAREKERKRLQKQYAAARRAATQRQIQEAERRRRYFESLSPEQKQAYLKQQQALRQKQAEANLMLLGVGLSLFMNGGRNTQQQQQQQQIIINQTPVGNTGR